MVLSVNYFLINVNEKFFPTSDFFVLKSTINRVSTTTNKKVVLGDIFSQPTPSHHGSLPVTVTTHGT